MEKEHTQTWNLSLVCKEEIGLPPSPPEFQTWWYWFRRFLWLHMSLESLDSRNGDAVPFTGFSMSWNHSLKNNLFRIPSRPLLMDARTPSWGVDRVTTETPKYSCRDCWTGIYPMQKKQQELEFKPLWGLKRIPLTDKPKEERILETVNRMITRIQTTKEKCLWSNTPTRPAWECRYPSRRIWSFIKPC